jgi:hypothetical protein
MGDLRQPLALTQRRPDGVGRLSGDPGETLAYFHQRVWEVHGEDTPTLAMGEFNDEPFDLSLVRYALSTRQRAEVLGGTSPRLWNLMWDILGAGDGFSLTTLPTCSISSWSTRTWRS